MPPQLENSQQGVLNWLNNPLLPDVNLLLIHTYAYHEPETVANMGARHPSEITDITRTNHKRMCSSTVHSLPWIKARHVGYLQYFPTGVSLLVLLLWMSWPWDAIYTGRHETFFFYQLWLPSAKLDVTDIQKTYGGDGYTAENGNSTRLRILCPTSSLASPLAKLFPKAIT